jgi:hypothetical protein
MIHTSRELKRFILPCDQLRGCVSAACYDAYPEDGGDIFCKPLNFTGLYGVIFRNTELLVTFAVRTPNSTQYYELFSRKLT